MIIEGHLLLPGPGGADARLAHGRLRVEAGRIAEVLLTPEFERGPGSPAADLGGPRCVVAPGFVDAHVHLPQFACVGVDGVTLLQWLERAVFPAEARWSDADIAGEVATRACRRFVAAGTTGIAAYATVHHAGTRAAIEAVRTAGLRGLVGQVLMDQRAPAELLRPAADLLREAAALGEAYPPGRGRVESAVTPRFAVSCSRPLLEGAGGLARATGAAVQTHLSETLEECAVVRELHAGGPDPTYTGVYERAGLLGRRSIFGHGIWLSNGEKATLASTGSVVAHCPEANIFLQSGTMDRAGHRRAGIRVALGSDVAGGPDVSMVRVARAMIETAKHRRLVDGVTPVPAAAEAWGQITHVNADALGWEDSGRLKPGAWADLLVIDPSRGSHAEPDWDRSVDPLSVLLYGWDEAWIAARLVEGRQV